MSNEVLIETAEGARYGVVSAGKARALYPGCTIVGYADGRAYEEKTAQRSRKSADAATGPDTIVDGPDVAGTVTAGEGPDAETSGDG